MYLCRIFCLSFVFLGTVEERLNRSVFFLNLFMDERRFSSRFVFWLVLMTTRVVTRQFQWRPLDDESTTPTSTTHNNRVDLSFFRVFKSEHFFFFFGGGMSVCVWHVPPPPPPPRQLICDDDEWRRRKTSLTLTLIFSLSIPETHLKRLTLLHTRTVCRFSLSWRWTSFSKNKKIKRKKTYKFLSTTIWFTFNLGKSQWGFEKEKKKD